MGGQLPLSQNAITRTTNEQSGKKYARLSSRYFLNFLTSHISTMTANKSRTAYNKLYTDIDGRCRTKALF
jgi:hypothetical protein